MQSQPFLKIKLLKNKIMQNNNLPTLAELHHDVQEAFKHDKLNLLLNQPPHAKWVKQFPAEMKIKGSYLPIDKVEFLLTRIFQQWKIEITDSGVAVNSCYVVVRLHYRNPITGEWNFHDGIGACPIQVDSGVKAADISSVKSRGVQMAFPIAKSAAVKDAADHLGSLFGRDLNRKDSIGFTGSYSDAPTTETPNGRPVNGTTANNISSSFEFDGL